ncbi:MAG TPA: DUF4430 domain-containing protein [Solirubrobacteraceae bacterium]|nr:DUF4430 domain-containing protein [Solirubrobacteraceae bacterium]
MTSKVAAVASAIAVALALAGCGLGAGKGTSDVGLTITRDFGSVPVGSVVEHQVPGSQTVMRMLERSFRISTRYGGGFVESINGISGNSDRRDWFYYVNGIEAPLGAAGTGVHKGDRIWWDLHDWSATDSIPAVVGSFPEPFVHGIDGRRYPTTLECASDTTVACQRVASQLDAIGVKVASQALGAGGSGTDSLAVVVGTWKDVQGEFAASEIEAGPGSSGIYARFGGINGSTLELLNPHGQVVRTLGAGAGLIAATGNSSTAPVWIVTGTDKAGVAAAASALTAARLDDHFAVAMDGQTDIPVPLEASS